MSVIIYFLSEHFSFEPTHTIKIQAHRLEITALLHLRGQTGSFYHPLGGSQDHKSSEVVLNLQPTQENWHANMLYERFCTLFRIVLYGP